MREIMKPAFRGAATLAIALSVTGISTLNAVAGGKSPPSAYDVTLENLSYDIYGIKLTYPKIDIKGSNIAKADIEKMLAVGTSSADRLNAFKTFSAGSVDIPATNLSFEAGKVKISASCNGDKMDKIAGGKIGKYTLSGCSGQINVDGKTVASFSFNVKSGGFTDYNFVHTYRLWTDKAGPDDKEAVAVSGATTLEGVSYTITAPDFDVKAEYGKFSSPEGAKVKLLSRPLKDVIAQGTALVGQFQKMAPDASGPTPEQIDQIKGIALSVIELIENTQPGTTIIENYTFTETVREPTTGKTFTINAKVGKAEQKGFEQQTTDVSFNIDKVTGKIGSFSWKGFSLKAASTEIKKLLNLPSDQLRAEALKLRTGGLSVAHRAIFSIYANLGTFSLNDLEVNAKGITKVAAPAKSGNDAPAEPAKPETVDLPIKLKNFTFRMDNSFNGIPTVTRLSFDNLQIPTSIFTLDGKAESLKTYATLQKLGMDNINASFVTDLSWNKDTKELNLNEFGGSEASLGSASLKASIGNFSETMFSWDPGATQMAAIGLTAKSVSLHTEDKGGLNKLLTIAAAEKGTTPDQLKAMVPLMAAMIPEPFASMNSIQTIKQALLAYWENPGKLDITIKTKSGAGLGLADFIATQRDPTSLDAKLDVTATATK